MKSIEVTVKGRVQGVGYRYFVRRAAEKYGIKGYVKNLHNGDVLIVAQGEENDIKSFLIECERGPSMAYVEQISVQDIPESYYKSFFIKI